jgi:hypothetical protein
VGDLLLASHNWEKRREGEKALLARLSETGYKVSWKKAQVASKKSDTSHSSSQKDDVL